MHYFAHLPLLQAVSAEGESLVDLLDNYLKACHCVKDKKIEPFGGVLYDQYNYVWNPPGTYCMYRDRTSVMASTFTEFDMNILQERLKEQKRALNNPPDGDFAFIKTSVMASSLTEFDMNIRQEGLKEQNPMREKAALNKTPPSHRKEQYTPVEVDTGADEEKLVESATTDSESSGERKLCYSPSSSTIENKTIPKRKPLSPTPAKKPSEAPNPKPIVMREDTSRVPPTQGQSLIDRMNQPLPPTPVEEYPIPSSAGQNILNKTPQKEHVEMNMGTVKNSPPKRKPLPPVPAIKPPKPMPRRTQIKRDEAKQVNFAATDSKCDDFPAYQQPPQAHQSSSIEPHQSYSSPSRNETVPPVPVRKSKPPAPANKPPKPKPRQFQEAAPVGDVLLHPTSRDDSEIVSVQV